MDKREANDLLRYGIKILKGDAFNSRPGTYIAHAIELKQRLVRAGFWWQAEKLDIWISRALRGDFTGPRAGPSEGEGIPHEV